MLSLIFNKDRIEKPVLNQVSLTFEAMYEEAWLNNQMVLDILEDIDKVVPVGPETFKHELFGTFSKDKLSTGSKNLILLLMCEELRKDYTFAQAKMGNNCAKWLQLIGEQFDATVYYEYLMEFNNERLKLKPMLDIFKDEFLYSNEDILRGYIDDRN